MKNITNALRFALGAVVITSGLSLAACSDDPVTRTTTVTTRPAGQ
jgi:hypothetical protein